MTYEQRRAELAEKMAEMWCNNHDKQYHWRLLSDASKKKRTKQMLPLADLAMSEMANVTSSAMLSMYYGRLSNTDVEQYLIDNGLVPQKQKNGS